MALGDNYYTRQIDQLKVMTTETVQVKVISRQGETHWMLVPRTVLDDLRESVAKLDD